MKRCITIFLFLLAVAGLRAQTPDISNCRMVKVMALLNEVDNKKYDDVDNPVILNFTLCYGAKSSGYASDDYIYLLGDNSATWNRYGCRGFMDMPTRVKSESSLLDDGTRMIQYLFWGDKFCLDFVMAEPANKDIIQGSDNGVVISNGVDKIVSYQIGSCDFYDISTGQERLVLKEYYPLDYNYNESLFYTFINNMYEYYR